jgi:serine phosphatase RsbU (regulator of sigma subunit)
MLERRLFNLIEGVSQSERDTGRFARALLESMLREFGDSLHLLAVAEFRRQESRYEIAWSQGEPLWDLLDRGLSSRNLHRHLSGQPWWIQRGLHRKAEDREDWYDLIFIPRDRELRQVLGLITSSMAGEEGQQREAEFQVLARLIRLFCDRQDHHERLQEIMTLAREQQMSILQPEVPSLHGYQTAQRSVPAQEVGGDYYQIIPLGGGNFAAAVADAKGKGFEAAVLVTALHAALHVANATPFKVEHKVRLINRALAAQGTQRNLISLFYGEFDDQGRLFYVNCSHPPPIVVRSDGIEELADGGLFLGLDPASDYRAGVCELRSGDLLVAYTDGWTELLNEQNEEFGAERLRDIVRPAYAAAPHSVIDHIEKACDAFRKELPFYDDRTLLVIRRDWVSEKPSNGLRNALSTG